MMSRNRILLFVMAAILATTFPLTAQTPEHESKLTERSFPQLPLPPAMLTLGDPEFARVAERIQAGTASIQERRWWYRAAERYAPFTAMPPADHKVQAQEKGKKIAATGPIYRWTSLGPNGD